MRRNIRDRTFVVLRNFYLRLRSFWHSLKMTTPGVNKIMNLVFKVKVNEKQTSPLSFVMDVGNQTSWGFKGSPWVYSYQRSDVYYIALSLRVNPPF